MRILLIEDEKALADALEYILKKNKYSVDVTYDGVSAQDMAEADIYDLIILDWMLPGQDGIAVLQYLRKTHIQTPVIFLTAKDAVSCRVQGLDAGADDYLIKPFSSDELLARVRALGRRSEHPLVGDKISLATLSLDPLRCETQCADEVIKLTLRETQLLEFLMRNHGHVLTKEQILEKVWGFNSEVEMGSIEIYIYYLRKKIRFDRCGISIDTVRGIGYCLKEI